MNVTRLTFDVMPSEDELRAVFAERFPEKRIWKGTHKGKSRLTVRSRWHAHRFTLLQTDEEGGCIGQLSSEWNVLYWPAMATIPALIALVVWLEDPDLFWILLLVLALDQIRSEKFWFNSMLMHRAIIQTMTERFQARERIADPNP